MTGKIRTFIKEVFERNHYINGYKGTSSFQGKFYMQVLTSFAFFLLSLANIFAMSYTMLILTISGCIVNIVFAALARKNMNGRICAASAIATCSILFGFFVIYGGNDGFACLWVVLLPLLSMIAMDFVIGLCANVFFQIFLFVVFWTPVREMLFYRYNQQFCLRFPLFFFTAFILALLLAISLQKSEYNEYKHRLELEEMTASAQLMARTDPLTKLANRRFAYEEFEKKFTSEGRHCIVMGDIDGFKIINDTYGHKFGDDVLVIVAECMNTLLPQDYLKVRWGGEEFLFAANATLAEVYPQIECLREAIAGYEFIYNGSSVHITITFGISEYSGAEGLIKAISDADSRLYNGKKIKKNNTVIKD